MADVRPASSWRYLPLVFAITASIVGGPLAALTWIESAYDVTVGPLPAAAAAVALSALLGSAGSAIWIRHPRSRDIVFGDLMLWGYVRRLINEHRVLKATKALGLDRSDGEVREIDLPLDQQTEILQKLAHALESNDPYTHGHSRRVARHSLMIAKTMGLPAEYVEKVFTAASIHDVGKLHLPSQVLNKPGRLTDEEFEIIKEHPVIGAAMVADLDNGEITAIVRHHHERLDGRGYPARLSGDAIPLGSRIVAVADTFDALTSTRAYRAASEHKVALDILKKEAGSQLDGDVVDAFLRYYSGRRSRTWWSAITTIPERILGWIGGGVERIGAAGVANGVTAAGAAVVIASASLGVPNDMPPRATKPASATQVLAASDGAETAGGSSASDRDGDTRTTGTDDSKSKDSDRRSGDGSGSDSDGSGSGSRGSGSDGSGSGSDGSGSDSDSGSGGSGSGSDNSGSGSDSDNSGSGSDSSGSGSGDSGSGSDSGSDSDNSGSGSDSDNSGSGSDSDNSGSGSDSSGSGSGDSGSGSGSDSGSGSGDSDGGGLIDGVLCGLLGC